jgi:hypothetical protein
MISEPMLCLVQIMYLSCTDTSIVSKQTKTRFYMTHIIQQFLRVHPKRFLSLWYVRHKTCTYLASTLPLSPNRSIVTLYPNEPNWDSIRPTLPCSFIVCVQNNFWAYGMWRKSCTYVAPTLTLSPNRPKRASTWASSPRCTIGCVENDFWAYGMFGANRAPFLH